MSEYDLNNPQSDVESYLANMDGILAPLPLPPESNVEKYLAHIVGVQGVELPHKPDSRVEAYLEKLALDPPQPVTPILIEKSITNNGVYSAGDDNADGYSKVTVEVPDPVLDNITITENGVYSSEHDGFDEVTVAVAPPEDSYQLKSITTPTSLATFNASAMPMPKLKVSVEAKQAGSGTPSPDNIRPISGWDAANVSDVGKNLVLFDDSTVFSQQRCNVSYADGGLVATANEKFARVGYRFDVKQGETYTFSFKGFGDAQYKNVYVNMDDAWNGGTRLALTSTEDSYSATFTATSNVCYIGVYITSTETSGSMTIKDAQLERGSAATEYVPYVEPNLYTISLPQTVYGGELDVVNGVLRITWKSVDMGSLTWSYSPTYTRFSSTGVQNEIKSGNNQDEVMCSCYGNVANEDMNAFKTTNGLIMVKDSNYTDTATFKQSVIGQQFVYMLETPIIIPLTPSLIKSLNGQNNLSVDCGDVIEGEYFIEL